MMNYHSQQIEILIDRESELWNRICARAERDGVTVEAVVNMLFTTGTKEFVAKQLNRWDIVDRNDRKKGI